MNEIKYLPEQRRFQIDIDGLEAANISLGAFGRFYGAHVPLHTDGLDWIFFALAGFLIGCLNRRKSTSSELITSEL